VYLCIASLAGLALTLLGEPYTEQAKHVSISGLHINVCLDEALPLAHQRSDLVRGESHAPEVGQACMALNFLHAEAHLAECMIFVLYARDVVYISSRKVVGSGMDSY
jgi:hypothetical protein